MNKESRPNMIGLCLDYGRLELTENIGSGTYGEVYLAFDCLTGEKKAIKVLKKPKNFKTSLEFNEIHIHGNLPAHPNIVRLEKVIEMNDYLFIVMEHCPGGDLYENIINNPVFSTPSNHLIKPLFLQLIQAVEHCHENGVYHRDLKPENIIIQNHGRKLKLIDFGLATTQPWTNDIGCGSSYYMSPECQGGLFGDVTHYNSIKNDIWSLGVIFINIACGRNPWNRAQKDDPTFSAYLDNPDFLSSVLPLSPQFNEILKRIFTINPKERINLYELKRLVESCSTFILSSSLSSSPISSTFTLIQDDLEEDFCTDDEEFLFTPVKTSTTFSWCSLNSCHFQQSTSSFKTSDLKLHHPPPPPNQALVADCLDLESSSFNFSTNFHHDFFVS